MEKMKRCLILLILCTLISFGFSETSVEEDNFSNLRNLSDGNIDGNDETTVTEIIAFMGGNNQVGKQLTTENVTWDQFADDYMNMSAVERAGALNDATTKVIFKILEDHNVSNLSDDNKTTTNIPTSAHSYTTSDQTKPAYATTGKILESQHVSNPSDNKTTTNIPPTVNNNITDQTKPAYATTGKTQENENVSNPSNGKTTTNIPPALEKKTSYGTTMSSGGYLNSTEIPAMRNANMQTATSMDEMQGRKMVAAKLNPSRRSDAEVVSTTAKSGAGSIKSHSVLGNSLTFIKSLMSFFNSNNNSDKDIETEIASIEEESPHEEGLFPDFAIQRDPFESIIRRKRNNSALDTSHNPASKQEVDVGGKPAPPVRKAVETAQHAEITFISGQNEPEINPSFAEVLLKRSIPIKTGEIPVYVGEWLPLSAAVMSKENTELASADGSVALRKRFLKPMEERANDDLDSSTFLEKWFPNSVATMRNEHAEVRGVQRQVDAETNWFLRPFGQLDIWESEEAEPLADLGAGHVILRKSLQSDRQPRSASSAPIVKRDVGNPLDAESRDDAEGRRPVYNKRFEEVPIRRPNSDPSMKHRHGKPGKAPIVDPLMMFLTVSLPTILCCAVLLIFCIFCLKPRGKLCTVMFASAQTTRRQHHHHPKA